MAAATPVALGAYAARQCPRRTHNQFDPAMGEEVAVQPTEEVQRLFDAAETHEELAFEAFEEALGSECVRIPEELSRTEKEAMTVRAMAAGKLAILGGRLPYDPAGRVGLPDILVRGDKRPDGEYGYAPVDVKNHKAADVDTRKKPGSVDISTPDRPSPTQAATENEWRLTTREGDWLQLAHYYRMLQAAGRDAPGRALGGLVGSRAIAGEQYPIVWVDLDEPRVKTYSKSEGSKLRSILERYDFEFQFRQDIAQRAVSGGPPLVQPIYQAECDRCPWQEVCPQLLGQEDATLQLQAGASDTQREWVLLRKHGIATTEQVASMDLDGPLVAEILDQVANRSAVRRRFSGYKTRAEMVVAGVRIQRTTTGAIDLPAFDVEVDFDIEWVAQSDIYLYGFLVTEPGREPTYHSVHSFSGLDRMGIAHLAEQAVAWLEARRDEAAAKGRSFGVFHYSSPEISVVRTALGVRHPSFETLVKENFRDLHKPVADNYRGLWGLGLKEIGKYGAGFSWRDDDPGGFQSQQWAADAIAGDQAAANRVLAYNEDDVRATWAVRTWLRGGGIPVGPETRSKD